MDVTKLSLKWKQNVLYYKLKSLQSPCVRQYKSEKLKPGERNQQKLFPSITTNQGEQQSKVEQKKYVN